MGVLEFSLIKNESFLPVQAKQNFQTISMTLRLFYFYFFLKPCSTIILFLRTSQNLDSHYFRLPRNYQSCLDVEFTADPQRFVLELRLGRQCQLDEDNVITIYQLINISGPGISKTYCPKLPCNLNCEI